MARLNERLAAVAAVVLIALSAAVTLVVLADARDRGVAALEVSKRSEVEAIARSFNQRQVNQIAGAQGFLADQEFDFAAGGTDQDKLDELLEVFDGTDIRAGFFLVDLSARVTAGILFDDPTVVGRDYERAGFADLVTSPEFFTPPVGGILPVGPGLTTSLPTTATVFPVFPADATGVDDLAGYFVSESPVASDSDFATEIGQLASQDTDTWRFLDGQGVVVASTDRSEFGLEVPNPALTDIAPGLYDIDGSVVVVESVPSTGWRVVFSQERDEFQDALTGPLQNAGNVLLVVLLLVGLTTVVMLVRQLRAARDEEQRLRQLNESQEEFMSIVSHELRTPVAGVLGFLQTSLDHWDQMSETERHQSVRRAVSNARRLQGLTRDILDTESVESGRFTYAFDEVDLRDEINAAVEAAGDANRSRVFEVAVPGEAVDVRVDPDRIQQVLTNLLDNADKNSPADKVIEVTLESTGSGARLTVHDHGPGIDEGSADRVFDKFVRGRGTTVSGTGLGLYVSRRIIEAHGGRIWVDSEGSGATFHFELPATDSLSSRALVHDTETDR